MKKLKVAIIGQGRSGRDIHGAYFLSERNNFYEVKWVVDYDEGRRKRAESEFGCKTFADYRDLYKIDGIDLVVNSIYSNDHYAVTKDLINHGLSVLVEKPFARSRYECDELLKLAQDKGVVLAVFQQSFHAPYYTFTREKIASGILGEVKQINLRFSGFARRWDWQTLQKRCAGGLYNTGPHPVGLGLGYLDFDKNTKVEYSRLSTALTSGDGDDYAKVILSAPNKPVIDIEVISCDAYPEYTVKIIGSRGTLKTTVTSYELTYIVDGENPDRPVQENFISDEQGKPIYCTEQLVKHTESGKFDGTPFDVGSSVFYAQLYKQITTGEKPQVTPEMARDTIAVIETVHAQNPLPVKF